MTEAELGQLLHVARWRPLAEYGREVVADDSKAGKRAGWHYRELCFDDISTAVGRARERLVSKPKLIEQLEH